MDVVFYGAAGDNVIDPAGASICHRGTCRVEFTIFFYKEVVELQCFKGTWY